MADINLPGNSIYNNVPDQNQKERLKPVVSRNSVVNTKPNLSRRLQDAFFGPNQNIWNDVIVPGAMNLFLDSMEMLFFHQVTRRNGYYSPPPPQTSYNYGGYGYGYNYNQQYNYPQPPQPQPQQNTQIDYRNIILHTRQDAEAVARQMKDRCIQFGSVSIADLFDLINVAGEFTDNNWGWSDPNCIGIRRVSQGFLIVVPNAIPLNM